MSLLCTCLILLHYRYMSYCCVGLEEQLFYASMNGHTAIVVALLDRGADINAKDKVSSS